MCGVWAPRGSAAYCSWRPCSVGLDGWGGCGGGVDLRQVPGCGVVACPTHRGWTLGELADRVRAVTGTMLSRQTLASYERGIRSCTVPRLLQLCAALGVDVATVLCGMEEQVLRERRGGKSDIDDIVVDLDGLAASIPTRLAPARAWARSMLDRGRFHTIDGSRTWRLTDHTLAPLATLCAIPPGRMMLLLGRYVHHPTRRPPVTAHRGTDPEPDARRGPGDPPVFAVLLGPDHAASESL
ncbi:helix-turn-helix domain-containing protein [Actinokineospora sp. HUAS TT18]|uniref:helix-turn-helix domain-containing protein n=1 Tax=Actinokineospora sp. HUAS TT18 TaxID=3447451 RepID=UPI003F51B4B3